MAALQFIISIWVYSVAAFPALGSDPWCSNHLVRTTNKKFEQKTDRFWQFHEKSNSWVELKLPFDLVSCLNDDCATVGTIKKPAFDEQVECLDGEKISDEIFPLRKRISLRKMSETSIWVTGESGSIYERFWNGVQWVLAPHDLPISAGFAVSVFLINQTLISLSEAGVLYQWQLQENSQPVWVEIKPAFDEEAMEEEDQASGIQIQSGFLSRDRSLYFCTKKGILLELNQIEPPRWSNHSRPPGADVAAIAEAASFRTDVVYTISSKGDLYEHDKSSKPMWKRHIWRDRSEKDVHLIPAQGCILNGLNGENSISLFLLTKGGNLVERRLYNRKWSWIRHERPENHRLTSITLALQDDSEKKLFSLFFVSSAGFIFEYRIQSHTGTASESWVNHMHPLNAKVARGIPGLQFQVGRILFALNDGRLGELHLAGIGGENSGPTHRSTRRKKASIRYVWSILDAPGTEGWNGEYCNEDRGPLNCVAGTKDDLTETGMRGQMKGNQAQESYLIPGNRKRKSSDEHFGRGNSISGFRLRLIHEGRSFFLVTDNGPAFEYLYGEEISIWISHESSTQLKDIVGNFNSSLFLVDVFGSLLIRERIGDEFTWINASALKKGKQIIGGPPWDGLPGLSMKVSSEDHSLFFVGKNGRLLQFVVFSRNYRWKDCKNPADTKVASIVDQEMFRENVVFVIGRNGQLYQYNKLTELWHEHYQSRHLILSGSSGTVSRPSMQTLRGSIFMVSREGGLVEYQWNTWEGWSWIEHGKPSKEVALVAPLGPCFDGNQLFSIGSDGRVYLRYVEKVSWKWRSCGFPKQKEEQVCVDEDFTDSLEENEEDFTDSLEENEEDLDEITRHCDAKVASTRPIQFSEDSIIFELRDGRVAEMHRMEDSNWKWRRIIATPTSLCTENIQNLAFL